MTKVRCESCGNIQEALGRWIYTCSKCGLKQTIENAIFEEENPHYNRKLPLSSKKEIVESDNSQEQNQVQTQQAKVLNTNFSSDKNSGILSSTPEPVENILEIEEDKNIITENKMTENKKEIFHCPECGAVVKEFEDCENCGAEMVWSTEED